MSATHAQVTDWQPVESIFGRKGTVQGDMLKVTFPRTDLHVKIGSVTIEPGLALTSWIAFKQMGDEMMIMGDLVLLDDEVAPVMKELVKDRIEVTAVHNHLLGENPKLKYLHFSGHGTANELAEKMKAALEQTKTPIAPPATRKPAKELDWSSVENILGRKGAHKGNLLQLAIARQENISEDGTTVPPFMGVATAINFQMIDKRAAATGDFVLVASEVNPVIKALTEHGITVTALHNHMLNESPRLFFMHFWGYDTPEHLASGLKAGLDLVNSSR